MFRLANLKHKHHTYLPRFLLITLGALAFALAPIRSSDAAFLNNRNLKISSGQASVVASHAFNLTPSTAGNIGSLVFEYCDSPVYAYPCSAPPGLDLTGSILTSQSGNTGFSIDNGASTANKVVLTRGPSAANLIASQYVFSNVTNPSLADHVYFVRLSSYATADASGPLTDNGAVAFATVSPFNVGADVPPFLRLCVGITVSSDCSSSSGTSLNLGDLSSTSANAGQSQFAGGTNSISGYSVFALGTTMTSGNNSIAANNSATPSFPGNPQFGINLRANSNPAVGQNPTGAGTAAPAPGYNQANFFKFHAGDLITTDSQPSDFNTMTVSYLVNVPSSQPGGIYSTTVTYLAVATF
jgi:hypothetical protein